MANGWAIKDDLGIVVETVSPTKRAAMCNWLVVNKSAVAGILINNVLPEDHIEALWNEFSQGAKVVAVWVTEMEDSDP